MPKRLTSIYTRNGDSGRTRLGEGTEVEKNHLRIAAIGEVDELNSTIGVVLASQPSTRISDLLEIVQHTLFDLGGELSMPSASLVSMEDSQLIERWIDEINAELGPLEEFILPGGTPSAAACHLARAVCRRAERSLVTLSQEEDLSPALIAYVNRLSDFLFVAARSLNRDAQHPETLWQKKKRKSDS